VTEGKLDFAAAAWRDCVDATALFVAFRAIAGEDDSIAGRDRSLGRDHDTPAANRFYLAD